MCLSERRNTTAFISFSLSSQEPMILVSCDPSSNIRRSKMQNKLEFDWNKFALKNTYFQDITSTGSLLKQSGGSRRDKQHEYDHTRAGINEPNCRDRATSINQGCTLKDHYSYFEICAPVMFALRICWNSYHSGNEIEHWQILFGQLLSVSTRPAKSVSSGSLIPRLYPTLAGNFSVSANDNHCKTKQMTDIWRLNLSDET